MLDFDRFFKNIDREINASRLGPRKSALLMPSRQCLDVQLLAKYGVINKSTKQWWIEGDPKIAQYLETAKCDMGFPQAVVVNTMLEKFVVPEPLDYVNADMMSAFTPELALWFNRHQEHLAEGATVVVNFLKDRRRGEFLNWFSRELSNQTPLMEKLGLSVTVPAFQVLASVYEEDDLIPRILFCCALNTKHFDWSENHHYRDGRRNMCSFRVDNVRPHNSSPWPSMTTLWESFQAKHVPMSLGKRAISPATFTLSTIQARLLEDHRLVLDMDLAARDWIVSIHGLGTILRRFPTLEDVIATFGLENG